MLNEALRLVRAFHDLSQTEMCKLLGISNSYLSEIESGKKQPKIELLSSYSEIFNIPVSSLLLFSENLEKKEPTDKLRLGAASKILTMLNWVADKSGRGFSDKVSVTNKL